MAATTDTSKPSKRAVAYARTARTNHHAIDQQLNTCRRLADEAGAQLVEKFIDDGVPGRQHGRAGLQQLLDYVESHPVDYVICVDFVRLSRSFWHCEELIKQLQERGVQVITEDWGPDGNPEATAVVDKFLQRCNRYAWPLVGRGSRPGISQ